MKPGFPTPSLAVACTALFVSLAGTGYAVTALPKNSVGTAQLRSNAVVSPKVRDGSLLAKDFKQGQLPAGPKGDKGDPGDKGDKGDRGDAGATNVVVRSSEGAATGYHEERALCNEGEVATGGGGYAGGWKLIMSQPLTTGTRPIGWRVAVTESSGTYVTAYVVCASP